MHHMNLFSMKRECEAVVRNGIDIELNVDSEAKKLISLLGGLLDIKKEDDGTEA